MYYQIINHNSYKIVNKSGIAEFKLNLLYLINVMRHGGKAYRPGGQGQAKIIYNPSTPSRTPLIFEKGVNIDRINTQLPKPAVESIEPCLESSLMDFAVEYMAGGVNAVRGALK